MAYGPPLFYLLVLLGGSLIDAGNIPTWKAHAAGDPVKGLLMPVKASNAAEFGGVAAAAVQAAKVGAVGVLPISKCVVRNSMCMKSWNVGMGGRSDLVTCQAWHVYDQCYRTNLQTCKQESGTSSSSGSLTGGNTEFTAETAQFHTEYERIIAILPRGCHISMAPQDSSGSETSGSSDIVVPTSVSSYESLPKSMRTRPVGSWSLYMTWWQWILFACCCCCCCLFAGCAAIGSKRRNNHRGDYDDEDQWAQPQPMYSQPQSFRQEVYPLMPQQQSYVMPTQQSYAMPTQQSYVVPHTAAMPTQYNMGSQQRMY